MDSLDSDFDSLSESCSSDDQEDMESLFSGQACTIFSSLEETIEKIDDFLLFERGFSHGDIVCLASDPNSQMGKVINLAINVDLENIQGCKIPNINSSQLQKIHSISVADYVALGAWLGKVEKSVDCLTVLFDDGTKCRLSAEGPEKIIPISTDLVDDPQYPFYPGQRVRIESSSTSRSTQWLCGSKKDKLEEGTVCNVDAGLVHVEWLSHAVMDGEWTPPPCLQDSKNLSVLHCFTHANWQLGDWCVLPAELSFPSAHASYMLKNHKQSHRLVQTLDPSTHSQQIAFIVKTKTKVDVQWQDGSQSHGLDSSLLFPVNVVDAHDFFPDAFVLEKGTDDDPLGPQFQRWGVVKSVDPKERTVNVKWCKSSPDSLDPEEGQIEEVVSAYELVEHPDYSYSPGEPICRVDTAVFHPIGGEADLKAKAVENGVEQNEPLSGRFLSYFGTVVGFKNGQVEVKWATGAMGKVLPYEIRRIDKCESSVTVSVLGDENVQQMNEELPLNNKFLSHRLRDDWDLNNDNVENSTLNSISQVTVGIFSSIASSLFGSLFTSLIRGYRCTSEDGHSHGHLPKEEALELSNLNHGGELQVADNLEITELLNIKEAKMDIVLPLISSNKHPGSFRQFDMVNDCSDHHFVQQSGMDIQSLQVKQSWLKKVHKEWSILERDLPETIFVRVCEERMDLLRSAVVGTAGTPYHDGLFFFDIYLPPQYPNEPPIVHYNSSGLRINPNLYESGKVCLSLLNTWSGSQSEVWYPSSSTILQVLLSLQALVLNERPYFNEAGFHMQIGKAEGEKNSIRYNENAFLVNCRSMLYLLRKPPMHFEALVEEHFSHRCRNILLACKAYMQGAPVGHPFTQENDKQETHEGSSTGFKIMLSKLYPKLVKAFSEKGFECSDSTD